MTDGAQPTTEGPAYETDDVGHPKRWLILGVLNSMLIFMGAGQAVQQILYGSIVLGLAWLYARLTGQ